MKRALLLIFLATLSLQASSLFDLTAMLEMLDISFSRPMSAEDINENEFTKNIVLRVDLKPTLVQTILTLASFLIPIKVHDLKLPDLTITRLDIGLNVTLTHVVLKSIELSDTDISGILPVNQRVADYVLPKITANISFDYYIKFGQDRPQTGSATVSMVDLQWQARIESCQGEIGKKEEGPVKGVLHSNKFEYTSIEGKFSDPYTQTEWDLLLGNTQRFKAILSDVIGLEIKNFFAKYDLRLLVNVALLKTNLIIGLTKPIEYPEIDLSEPDNRAVSLSFHSIVTLASGTIIEPLFPTDMTQDPLSTKYTSIILATDIVNRILKSVTTPKSHFFSFNQALLDFIHFRFVKLDTSSLKAFFPTLESKFGRNSGVYMKVYLPSYDSNQCHVRTNAGFGNIVLAVMLEVYVCSDAETYKTMALDDCLAAGKCMLAVSNLIELLAIIPLQFTTDKKIAPGYVDLEITNLQIIQGIGEDGELLREKLNNFLDLIIPHLLPEFDISMYLAPFLVSLDAINDQRLAIGIALDQ